MLFVSIYQLGAVDILFGWLIVQPISNGNGYWLTLSIGNATNHVFMMFLYINVTSLVIFLLMLV